MIVRKRKAKKMQSAGHLLPTATVASIDINSRNHTFSNTTAATPTKSTRIIQNSKTQRITNFVVYIREFDKIDEHGIQRCRNHDCMEPVCKPFKKYCSKKCCKQFTKWYNSNFYWRNVRNRVLKRDNYTCQICRVQLHKRKRYNKSLKNWLECDHIIPKSYFYHLGYQFDTLDNKIKTILEFVHNGNNLRTLCNRCHKKLSLTVVSERTKLLDPQ